MDLLQPQLKVATKNLQVILFVFPVFPHMIKQAHMNHLDNTNYLKMIRSFIKSKSAINMIHHFSYWWFANLLIPY